MDKEKFKRVMSYLDKVEAVLDEISIATKTPTFNEFILSKGG